MPRSGVFISHAHEDHDLAQSLRQLIEASLGLAPDDITCTSDADYGLLRGDDLLEQVRHRLNSAKALFLLATPAARQRDWVNFECGFAESAREKGEMQFFVLTPTESYRDSVPLPYQGRIAVTLSNGADVHAFIGQLRHAFDVAEGHVPEARYVGALLDLERRCAALDRDRIRTEHESGLARNTRMLSVALAAGAVLAGTAGFLAGVIRSTNQVSRLSGTVADLQSKLSVESVQANEACDVELKKLPFAGLVHNAFLRPVPCTSVEALVLDEKTGDERRVPQKCDSGGTFTFSGTQLQSDPRQPITLQVNVGAKDYRIAITRARERLAIQTTGGR